MNAETWKRVRLLFEHTVELPRAQWRAHLEAELADAPELIPDVLKLLESDQAAAQGDATGLAGHAPDLLGDLARTDDARRHAELIGRQIGPWRIEREIGRGGMGSVFLASRVEGGFEQQAALKRVRPGMGVDEILARFRMERQILAGLNHPNIAHLLDGGVDEEGLPWLALEYVDGESITRHCDANQLDSRDRIGLFLSVCDAVSHAHDRLVIHRDLKPSNILVDHNGQVKLLDFGIAKLLAGHAAGTSETRAGIRVLTPEYAAPEQIRGENLTVACDVYALGLLLFELLTGRKPYHVDTPTPEAWAHAILDQPASRPSNSVTRPTPTSDDTSSVDSDELARRRGVDPARLRKLLRGDLDAIVLRALRKEPALRYASVREFAEDLRNYLEHRPVLARRGDTRYRLGRFLRRHALASALGAVALLSLVGGLLGALWQAEIARDERDRATTALATAEQVTEFLVRLLSQTTPDAQKGRELTVREVLDASAESIASQLEGQPAVRARIQTLMGNIYDVLGDYPRALALLAKARATYAQLHGERSVEVADVLDLISVTQRHTDELDAAMQTASLARAIYAEHLGERGEKTLWMISDLGTIAYAKGDYPTAAAHFADALAGVRALENANVRAVANILHNHAAALGRAERHDEAEAAHLESLAIRRSLFTDPHTNIAIGLHQLGMTSFSAGRYERAEQWLREAHAQYATLYGEDSVQAIDELAQIGKIRLYQDRIDEAVAELGSVLGRQRTAIGEPSEDTASTATFLAEALLRKRDVDAAQALIQEAVAEFEQVQPEGHPSFARALQVRAEVAIERGDIDSACDDLSRAQMMLAGSFSNTHSQILAAQAMQHWCAAKLGNEAGAAEAMSALAAELATRPHVQRALRERLTARAAALKTHTGQPERD